MSDEAAFTRAICENPECDTTRLVYADWLEEHGQPERAEFIRSQVQLSTFDAAYYLSYSNRKMCEGSAVPLIAATARLLRPAWGAGVFADMMALDFRATECSDWEFRRGFVSHIELNAADFLKHAAAIFASHPVTAVRLRYHEPIDNSDTPVPGDRWIWVRASLGDDPRYLISWEVPFELWDDSDGCFETADAAHDWLSRRCVAWGRAQVKPPLPVWQPRKDVAA